jgi:hypothetical protein
VTPIFNPCLTIFSSAVGSQFFAALNEAVLRNGMIARCLVIEAPERGYGVDPEYADLPPTIIDRAKEWISRWSAPGFAPTVRTVPYQNDKAKALTRSTRRLADDAHKTTSDAGEKAIWSRVSEQASKLAMIRACSRDGLDAMLCVEDVQWGWDVAQASAKGLIQSLVREYATDEQDRACKRVLSIIRDAGEIPHSAALKRSKMPAKEFMGIISTLIQTEDVGRTDTATTGRPVTIYTFIGE